MLTGFGVALAAAADALALGVGAAVGPHATTTPTAAKDCRKRRRFITPSPVISRPPPAGSAADYRHVYLVQSATLYISESHGDGSTPLRVLLAPLVTAVRWISGITATSWIRKSFACRAMSARLAGSVSVPSAATSASKSLFEYRARFPSSQLFALDAICPVVQLAVKYAVGSGS